MAPSCPNSNPKMKRWYTSTIGVYEEFIDNTFETKKFELKTNPFPEGEYSDLLKDYLDFSWKYPEWFTQEDIGNLTNSGYDLNPENWAAVVCVYLPFIHFIYLPENLYL